MKQPIFQRTAVLRISMIGLAALLCSLLLSCEIERTKIPDCAVFLKRNINEGLLAIPSFLYVTSTNLEEEYLGYAGIVIVHRGDMEEPYCAFDIACPNCVSPSIRVSKPDSMTLICSCPVCGEHYDLIFGLGNPTKHISKVGMKKYSTNIYPNNERYIIVEP